MMSALGCSSSHKSCGIAPGRHIRPLGFSPIVQRSSCHHGVARALPSGQSSATSSQSESTSYSSASSGPGSVVPVSTSVSQFPLLQTRNILGAPTRALPANSWGKPSLLEKRKGSSSGGNNDDGGEEEEQTWGFLDLKRYSHNWEVPWGVGTIVGGLVLWLLSFVGTGFIVVPGLYRYAGLDIFSLDADGKATFTLVTQIAETIVTLSLIRVLTFKQLDTAPEETKKDLFVYSPAAPFQKPRGWAVWAAVGILLSPFLVGATALIMQGTGYDAVTEGGRGTADGVAKMITIDWNSYLSLISVTGVLAPILEETVFRGFLLTSLTKYMPTWGAVVLSSLAFGAAHVSPKDFPVLCALGVLLGFSYVRTRNLLTPILIHGAWNSTVLTLLYYLAASGVDIEVLLKEMR